MNKEKIQKLISEAQRGIPRIALEEPEKILGSFLKVGANSERNKFPVELAFKAIVLALNDIDRIRFNDHINRLMLDLSWVSNNKVEMVKMRKYFELRLRPILDDWTYSSEYLHRKLQRSGELASTFKELIDSKSERNVLTKLIIGKIIQQPDYVIQRSINKAQKKRDFISYKWFGELDNESINSLYKKMKGTFILASNPSKNFKAIFSGIELKLVEPVKWKTDSPSEVIFFLRELMDRNLIDLEARWNYNRLTRCFVKPNGKQFESKFSTLKSQVDRNLSVKTKREIIKIIESII